MEPSRPAALDDGRAVTGEGGGADAPRPRRFRAPAAILGVAGAVYLLSDALPEGSARLALLVLAAGFGWKLSEHLHYWRLIVGGEESFAPEVAAKARLKAVLASVVYAAVAALVVLILTD